MSTRRRNILIIGVVGIAFIIFISVFGAINMDKAPVFTLVLYAGLIVVTMFYAYYSMETANAAREQAEASVKMAKEMREQRYNAIRPVLDIKKTDTLELSEESKTTNLGSLMEVAEGNIPPFIYCSICNVGLGTALDTYTEIDFNGEIFPQHYLGTITCGENRNPLPLRVKKEDEHHVLTVTYKDMYGRDIKSSREVLVQNHSIELGPLHIIVNGELKKND